MTFKGKTGQIFGFSKIDVVDREHFSKKNILLLVAGLTFYLDKCNIKNKKKYGYDRVMSASLRNDLRH